MDIMSLGLHITDCCNARCLHCAFGCGSELEGSMRLKDARECVTAARALGADIACVTGGEPMLYPILVERMIRMCNRSSFSEIWLFTNGFWANSTSKARTIAGILENSGLTKMWLSVDHFHQSFVPIEFVRNAVEASLERNLEVCIDARFIGEPEEENEFNSATRSHLEALGSLLSEVEVTKAQPMFVGRAAETLADHVKKKPLSQILNDECPGPWAGGTLELPRGVDVDEFGYVTICPGLSIGNVRHDSFRRIVEEYDYRNHAVIKALRDHGLADLMHLASEYGFVPKEGYVHACHLCYEIRKSLRDIFPGAFTFQARKSP
jgi:MoaA/NifB/PqqE/SkfB family radical SAM enzyme